MYIGIMSCTQDMEGNIPSLFSTSEYLLIMDADNSVIHAIYPRNGMTDSFFARKLILHNCEAVICGPIEKEPFLIIADEGCITRYCGAGLTVKAALRAMLEDRLPYLVDFIGGTGCESEHSSCDCAHGDHT